MPCASCQKYCGEWKGMINFLKGIPYYAIADKCIICTVWYPKYAFKRCPCCKWFLRGRRTRYPKGSVKFRDMPKEEVRQIIENAYRNGWRPLKVNMWRKVLEYRIAKRMV